MAGGSALAREDATLCRLSPASHSCQMRGRLSAGAEAVTDERLRGSQEIVNIELEVVIIVNKNTETTNVGIFLTFIFYLFSSSSRQ